MDTSRLAGEDTDSESPETSRPSPLLLAWREGRRFGGLAWRDGQKTARALAFRSDEGAPAWVQGNKHGSGMRLHVIKSEIINLQSRLRQVAASCIQARARGVLTRAAARRAHDRVREMGRGTGTHTP